MKIKSILTFLSFSSLLLMASFQCAKPQTCVGYVIDGSTLQPIVGAAVQHPGGQVMTDSNGNYQANFKSDKEIQITVSKLNYQSKTFYCNSYDTVQLIP
jgi:hypothetical protein